MSGSDTTLHICRGLPASGKTTWARSEVDRVAAECGPGHLVRINRDDLRRGMLESTYGAPQPGGERAVTAARDAAVDASLAAGISVICDDTNLRAKYLRSLMVLAERAGATVAFEDFPTCVDECVRRDSLRSGVEHVGEDVIREIARRYVPKGRLPDPPVLEATEPVRPYERPEYASRAIVVDLDGTLALLDRSPYDESCVKTDRVNEPVRDIVWRELEVGTEVVFLSGRTEECRQDTLTWIAQQFVGLLPRFGIELHMRAEGDKRQDRVIKSELFDAHIRDRYDVAFVLDDRDQVVQLWRSLGLACFQVAPGNF